MNKKTCKQAKGKTLKRLLAFLPFYLLTFLLFASCSDDDLDSQSIFDDVTTEQTDFDQWIYKNYTLPYNIRLYYRLQDIESDYNYTLAPADYDKSIQLAHIVKYAWIEAYDEVAGRDFTATYVPKILHFVGSAAYNNGTMVLGTAEGGMKVTLYLVNSFSVDRDILNTYYFKTMHHEFAHILHQTKNYPTEYDQISAADYISGDWYTMADTAAHHRGFVTPYSMSEAREDIAEVTSEYVTKTATEWQAIIDDAGTSGAAIINRKLTIVKNYMQDSWGIDLDNLRSVVQRRMDDIVAGNINLTDL